MLLSDQLKPYIADPKDEGTWSFGVAGSPAPPGPGGSVLFASLIINLFSLALPIVILQVYDRILPYQATQTLLVLSVGLVVILLLDGLFRTARAYITGWNAARFEHLAACSAVDRILSSNINVFQKESPGVHLDRLAAISTLRDFHAGQAKLLVVDLPFILLFLALIYFIAGSLVLLPIGIFALLAVLAGLLGRRLRAALEERSELDDRRYSFVIEILSGIHSIKLLAMEALMQRRFERLQESTAASSYDVTQLGNLAQSLGWCFSNLTMVGVTAAGSVLVMQGQMSIGGLAACTLLAGRSVQPVLRAMGLWAQYQGIDLAKKRLARLFEMQCEAKPQPTETPAIAGNIELEELSFGYGDNHPTLFTSVSLKISAGEVIGITGASGLGKTTLLMLIMGALQPTGGRIKIDGRDIAEADLYALRRQIAYMPQTAVLFRGTILENLTLFQGSTAVDNALNAARLLGVDEAIRHLPEGYQTMVGDGAEMELPVGLRQGIGMARAIAQRPRVVLFDEANGGLDAAADNRLKSALETLKGKASIVIVSHRPSLLALADRQFDIVDGGLVPRGGGVRTAGSGPAGASRPSTDRGAAA